VTILFLLVLFGALAALVCGLIALRSYLRLRRARKRLGSTLLVEVENLSRRATGLEGSLRALDARAQALPIRIESLQRNLATLGVLANALAVSVGGVRRVLTPVGLKSSLASPLARASRLLLAARGRSDASGSAPRERA